eukprot:Sspe_Gene.113857::Locus_98629_Transcript_1_1_Confidence_1.000_Length_1032::g.113857::m.113857
MAQKGTVKKWNLAKGFGFVTLENGVDVFVHASVVETGRLAEGKVVNIMTKDIGHASGRLVADSVEGEGVVQIPSGGGSEHGVVKAWLLGRAYGFIRSDDGKDVYVHCSAFLGGKLEEGKEVYFDTEDVSHKTGRLVATNVSGPAVMKLGEHKGIVKRWMAWRGYGFVTIEGETEVYVHRTAIGGGWLAKGKTVYLDTCDEGHKSGRLVGTNVTGPAVRSQSGYSTRYRRGSLGDKGGKGKKGGWWSPPQQGHGVIRSLRKGYGFIGSDMGGDLYFHASALTGKLREGDSVVFDALDIGHPSGRMVAVAIYPSPGKGGKGKGKGKGKG